MCESFFATLECELLAPRRFASQAQARMAVFSYIEWWYNLGHPRHPLSLTFDYEAMAKETETT